MTQRRQWHPTPVFLPRKSHGLRSLVRCSPWSCEESDTTERLHFHVSLSCIGEGNGNPLQCSCLENPRDAGAWWASIYRSHRVGHNWSDLAVATIITTNEESLWPYELKLKPFLQFSSVQSLSGVRLFAIPWIAARQASLSITNSRSWLKLTSIESVMPSSRLILCCPFLLLPPVPPSIRVFSTFAWGGQSTVVFLKHINWLTLLFFLFK